MFSRLSRIDKVSYRRNCRGILEGLKQRRLVRKTFLKKDPKLYEVFLIEE